MNLIVWHDAEVKITGVSDCIREFYLLVCSWEKILLPLPEITCLSRARYESEQILFKESQARSSQQMQYAQLKAKALAMVKTSTRI